MSGLLQRRPSTKVYFPIFRASEKLLGANIGRCGAGGRHKPHFGRRKQTRAGARRPPSSHGPARRKVLLLDQVRRDREHPIFDRFTQAGHLAMYASVGHQFPAVVAPFPRCLRDEIWC